MHWSRISWINIGNKLIKSQLKNNTATTRQSSRSENSWQYTKLTRLFPQRGVSEWVMEHFWQFVFISLWNTFSDPTHLSLSPIFEMVLRMISKLTEKSVDLYIKISSTTERENVKSRMSRSWSQASVAVFFMIQWFRGESVMLTNPEENVIISQESFAGNLVNTDILSETASN